MQKETQVIRWVDHKEEKVPECRNNRSHSDPTANEAIFCGADVQGRGPFIGRPVGGSQCR